MASCAEQDCLEPPLDYVRIAMSTASGSVMTVECLLCELHIATMEMANMGTYMFIRPRNRLDLNGR
jgi:hypothetical protein